MSLTFTDLKTKMVSALHSNDFAGFVDMLEAGAGGFAESLADEKLPASMQPAANAAIEGATKLAQDTTTAALTGSADPGTVAAQDANALLKEVLAQLGTIGNLLSRVVAPQTPSGS